MKKSFKKAGAAVLSMAMLLSMGAMSMPVYAETPSAGTFGQLEPGQVTVKVTGLSTDAYHQGEGSGEYDSTKGEGPDTDAKAAYETANPTATYSEKYDYLTLGPSNPLNSLKNIEEAEVTMYQVATLTNDGGWDWVQYVKDQPGNIPGFTSFAALLANKDGRDKVDTGAGKNTSDITGELEFTTSSKDLQQIASHLERIVDGLEKSVAEKKAAWDADSSNTTKENAYKAEKAKLDAIKVGDGKINQSNVGTGLTIPNIKPVYLDGQGNSNGVLEQSEQTLTTNTIGYYLIVTKTDQAGTIVQPVLVSLHNGEHKNVSVKGSTIQFEKTMTHIYSTDEDDAAKGPDRFASTEGSDLKNGLVAKDDVVSYEIKAQLPQYDPNVKQRNITNFVIHDTASDGITIDAPTLTGDGDAATIIDPDKFEVYLATDPGDLNDASKRWKLTGSTKQNVGDYQLVMDTDKHGFDLIISGYQMVQEDTRRNDTGNPAVGGDQKPDTVAHIENSNAAELALQTMAYATRFKTGEGEANQSGEDSMYNMYVLVKFKATVNKDEDGNAVTDTDEDDLAFNREFKKYKDIAEVDDGMLAAVGETDLVEGVNGATATDVTNAKKADAMTQIIRAKLFGGETRYNHTYDTADYGVTDNDFASMDSTKATAIATLLNATGLFTSNIPNNWNTDTTNSESELARILVLLARDKYNITLNGDYNTAHMTYGNRYAVGDGDVKMTTNYSKVYSVGLKLSKFIETVQLKGVLPIQDNKGAYADFWDANQNTTFEIPYTDGVEDKVWTIKLSDLKKTYGSTDTGDDAIAYKALTSSTLSGSSLTTPTDDGTATEDQKRYFDTYDETDNPTGLSAQQRQVLAYLIAQQKAAAGADGKYEEAADNSKKAVEGAIFHLTRIAENNSSGDATVVKDYGYAVSKSNGDLIKLELVGTTTGYDTQAEADAVTVTNGKKKFVFKDGNKWYVGVADISGTTVTGDNTWDMLDIGYYEINEVSVPVGFKKWDKARFQIEADKDTAGKYLVANSWTGAYSAKALNIEKNADATTSHGLASIKETQDTVNDVTFKYYDDDTTKAHSDGYLSHELYNEYLDELPATGGMGTVLFTAGGIAVILMAGALFVVYMKKRNAEEEE